jgi:hypothetical protein
VEFGHRRGCGGRYESVVRGLGKAGLEDFHSEAWSKTDEVYFKPILVE